MKNWTFEYSVTVAASRENAWAFWSNVDNWAVIDPAVEWARVDGDFKTGALGETKPVGAPANAWRLAMVDPERRAVIELLVPGVEVRFSWSFEDDADGTALLTQFVEVSGDTVERYPEQLTLLAEGIPSGMHKLATAIELAAITC